MLYNILRRFGVGLADDPLCLIESCYSSGEYREVIRQAKECNMYIPTSVTDDNAHDVCEYCTKILISWIRVDSVLDAYLYYLEVSKKLGSKTLSRLRADLCREKLFQRLLDTVFCQNAKVEACVQLAQLPFEPQDELDLIQYIKQVNPNEATHDFYLYYLAKVKNNKLEACYFYFVESCCKKRDMRKSEDPRRWELRERYMIQIFERAPVSLQQTIERELSKQLEQSSQREGNRPRSKRTSRRARSKR